MTSEHAFIQSLKAIATHPAARGLGDDAAVLEVGGEALILTHDAMVEGLHYFPDADPADVAWKLVATNLSDLAAKGAEPLGVLLGYVMGRDDARFVAGLGEALAHYGVPLLGGDTTGGGPPQTVGLTAIGRATHRPVPSRSGARAGDLLCITGPVGAAMLGHEALRDGTRADTAPFLRPDALLKEGQALAPLVTAMMDVSDGVLLDSFRLAQASGATAVLDSAAVPLAAPEERRQEALRWGDDYQLLFTVPPQTALPVPAHPIGRIEQRGDAQLLVDGTGYSSPEGLGYLHQ